MKKYLTIYVLSVLLLIRTLSEAQKYDYNWIIGYGGNHVGVESSSGLMQFNFNQGLKIYYPLEDNQICNTGFDPAAISNENGELLYFTDGFNIYNRKQKILKGGEHINPGDWWDGYYGGLYPIQNGALFLTKPGSSNQYYLFHKGLQTFLNPLRLGCDKFYYSLIDGSGDHGDGEAIEKNKVILEDDLDVANLAACRHANGRDWWLIQKQSGEAKYFIFLLDPNGVKLHHEQTIGFAGSKNEVNGNSVFSPNGEKYIQANQEHHLIIMDFDRCSGTLSNSIHIINEDLKDTTEVFAAVSANSRFLYFSEVKIIWQYDLNSTDIQKSVKLVATFDGYVYNHNWDMNFYTMQLAPDNQIYISCWAGNSGYIHRINYPDMEGLACEVEQRAVKLPAEMGGALPPSANYKLGPIIGSSCDSIFNIRSNFKVGLYPNPFVDNLKIEILQNFNFVLNINLLLYNAEGKQVLNDKFTNTSRIHDVSVQQWAQGIYFYSIIVDGNQLIQGKLVKL